MPRLFRPPKPETPIQSLWNMSDLTAKWLNKLGIFTYADLEKKDLLKVWADLKEHHKQVSKLMYYALWGAVANIHWKNIPPTEVQKIDNFVKLIKAKAVAKSKAKSKTLTTRKTKSKISK